MAREAGDVCKDPSPDDPLCACGLPPGHVGNYHWCFDASHTQPRAWPVLGKEIPIKTFVAAETQCPACATVYAIAPSNVADSVIVLSTEERKKLPKVIEMEKKVNGP
jgi:hypothetical protein